MEYTGEQFSVATTNILTYKSGVVDLKDIEFQEGISLVVNLDIIVLSQDNIDWVRTVIIRVKDIANILLTDKDTVSIKTSVDTFKIHTKGKSQELALALISVLSPK